MRVKHEYKLRHIVRNDSGRIIHADISFMGSTKALRQKIDGAQEVVDKELQKYVMDYVPLKSGNLRDSVPANTHVGDGSIVVGTAYGHYQNFLDMPYKTLKPSDTRYVDNPDRGSHFIERAIQDHGKDVIAAAQKYLDGGGSK